MKNTRVTIAFILGTIAGMVIANYLTGGLVKTAVHNLGEKIKTATVYVE
jgi:hypothetical protein